MGRHKVDNSRTPARLAMAEMYVAGSRLVDIATHFGVSVQWVSRCLKALKTTTRKGNWTGHGRNDERRAQVFAMIREGKSHIAIAKHFSVGDTVIYNYVQELKRCPDEYASVMDDAERSRFFIACGVQVDAFPSLDEAKKAWARFTEQRGRARGREIEWDMTFAEWWKVWSESGHWNKRGRAHRDVYVMARFGDVGPYSLGNVEIITHSQNMSDSWKNVDRGLIRNDLGQFQRKVAAGA